MFPETIDSVTIDDNDRHDIKIPVNRKYPSISLSFINESDYCILIKKKDSADEKAVRVLSDTEKEIQDLEVDICELRCGYLILEIWTDDTIDRMHNTDKLYIEKWERNYKPMKEGTV
jgi:hypothetical protein